MINVYSLEDKLRIAARVSNADKTSCQLLEDAANEIASLEERLVQEMNGEDY